MISHEREETRRDEEYLQRVCQDNVEFDSVDRHSCLIEQSGSEITDSSPRNSLSSFEDGLARKQFGEDTTDRPDIDGWALRRKEKFREDYGGKERPLT